ncbi:MAG: protein O-mannosyl-transferase family [Candidatus Limnocylindrales bacterium]
MLQPFGEPAFRMNVLSAICLAVAAGLTVDLVRALTRSTALGVLAGVGLALTPIAWSIGTHADAHALHLVFVVMLLRLLLAWEVRVRRESDGDQARRQGRDAGDLGDRYLVAAAVVFGLGLGTHSLILLMAPAIGLFVFAVEPAIRQRRRLVLTCVAALAVTVTVVYLELPLRAGPFRAPLVYGRPETWDGFWYVAIGQQFLGSLVDPFGDLPRKLGDLFGLAVDQFGPLAVLIPFGFIATARRRPRFAMLTGASLGLTCFFAASYENADIGRYYLGPIVIAWAWLAVLAGSTVDSLAIAVRARAGSRSRSGRAGTALAVVVAAVLLLPTVLAAPGRLPAIDESDDHSAAAWTDRALGAMQPNALIVSWWSYSTPLWYAQRVEGRRPDLTIVDDRTRLDEGLGEITDVIDANLGIRPVYVIRSDPDEVVGLAARYRLEPVDGAIGFDLTRVVARLGAGS